MQILEMRSKEDLRAMFDTLVENAAMTFRKRPGMGLEEAEAKDGEETKYPIHLTASVERGKETMKGMGGRLKFESTVYDTVRTGLNVSEISTVLEFIKSYKQPDWFEFEVEYWEPYQKAP